MYCDDSSNFQIDTHAYHHQQYTQKPQANYLQFLLLQSSFTIFRTI